VSQMVQRTACAGKKGVSNGNDKLSGLVFAIEKGQTHEDNLDMQPLFGDVADPITEHDHHHPEQRCINKGTEEETAQVQEFVLGELGFQDGLEILGREPRREYGHCLVGEGRGRRYMIDRPASRKI
jgi:hypothetical protein